MTVIHLIPDLFMSGENPFTLGLYILLGFFLQKVLENFSNGVEHGHMHLHTKVPVTYLLIALVIPAMERKEAADIQSAAVAIPLARGETWPPAT